MKKTVFVILSVFWCIVSFGQDTKLSMYDSLKIMPPFRYYTLSGDTFTQNNLNDTCKTVIIFFSPDCGYCEREARFISGHYYEFPSTQFLFVSVADTAALKKFKSDYKLDKEPQIKMLCDKDNVYHQYTIAHYTPSIHIYDKEKSLLNYSDGALSNEDLRKYLK